MKTILLAGFMLLAGLVALPVASETLVLSENAPEVYVVKKGDTLWGIAGMYLRDPWMWPEIWEVNPQLDNPNLIFPGDELYLVYVDGRPRLQVRRGAGSRTVKLTPQMRIEPLDTAIPMISLEKIGPWLRGHRVLSAGELESAPYVVAGQQRRLLSAAGDQLYARGVFPPEETGFNIYRQGDTYIDPLTEEVLGIQAEDMGSAKLLDNKLEDVSQLEVTRVTEDVRQGDRLMPNESRDITPTFQPRAPDMEVDGFMIAVDGGVSQIGTLDVVAINRGQREGMEEGHVLAIYQTGEVVWDPLRKENVKVPDSRAGLLMVFRAFEKMSYGIVMKSNRTLAVMDRVTSP
jgi:nucleoid-associated protein YgaU